MFKLLIFVSLAFGTAGQLLLKKGAVFKDHYSLREKLISLAFNPHIIAGVLFYGISAALWIVVLNRVALSYAYPLVSTNYILIALFSKFLFKERIPRMRWLSIAVITAGVILVTLS